MIHFLSAVLFLVTFQAWMIFLWKLLPTLAASLAQEGRRLFLFTRVAIAVCNHLGHWSLLWFPLLGYLYVYVTFFFRPAKGTGAFLVLCAVLLFLLSTVTVYLLSLFQWATLAH